MGCRALFMVGIKDLLGYKSISALKASPGGKRLCFDVQQPQLDGNRYSRELWVLQNGAAARLLADGEYAGQCTWLTDDVALYVKECKDGASTLVYWDFVKGGPAGELTIPAAVGSLRYLGGDWLAYTTRCDLRDEKHPAELAFLDEMPEAWEIIDEIPLWGDGQGYLSLKRNTAFLYNLQTGESTRLLAEESNVDALRAADGLLYLQARTYRGRNTEPGLYCHNPATGETETLVAEGTYRIFDFAAEQGRVVFVGQNKHEKCMTDDPAFYEATGAEPRRLPIADRTAGNGVASDCYYGETETFRLWDGMLYFVTSDQRGSFLVRANTASGHVEPLTENDGDVESFVLTPEGIYLHGLRGQALQEVYSVGEGGALTALTAINADMPGEAIVPEWFTFENHGYNVNYVVIKPAGYSEADAPHSYPAIFTIHGGAKVLYTDVFYHEMQYLASCGYFVIYGNPHGSDGQGSGFARLLGEYGQKDYDDIMKAVDTALALYPAIDPERLGVQGGSYGGIMTNWCVGHTDRFKAAVAQRSICNMVSTFGTADNGFGFVKEQMDGDLWDGFDKLWTQSPLKYADNCKTPLLLIHSTEDYRCHYTEAVQMFTAMKYLGVESRLCLIEGECHSLSRCGRPKQRLKRLYEIRRWFDTYLKAGKEA